MLLIRVSFLMVVVLSTSAWLISEVKSNPVVTDVRVGGDDGLTLRFAEALRSAILRSPDFVIADGKTEIGLIMTIPSNLKWNSVQGRTRFSVVVTFTDAGSREIGVSTGECWDGEMSECAEKVLKDARIARVRTSVTPRTQ